MYVEAKSAGHNGEAWIGLVTFSKTGNTVSFNGRAYKRMKHWRPGMNRNDIETGVPSITTSAGSTPPSNLRKRRPGSSPSTG